MFARTLPDWVVTLGGVVTQLADAWFLLVVAGAVALAGRQWGVTVGQVVTGSCCSRSASAPTPS